MKQLKLITPKKAILLQCRYCLNTTVFRGCDSVTCKLNDDTLSNLKRIKAHCMDCLGAPNSFAVRQCDGKFMSGDICSVHPFRLGHNPNRKGIGRKNLNSRSFFQSKMINKAAVR